METSLIASGTVKELMTILGAFSHIKELGNTKFVIATTLPNKLQCRVNGEKHGSDGEFVAKGCSRYVGDFSSGEITGKGKKIWDDGRQYEGEWLLGEMHGKGTWISADGKEKYEGYFVDNRRNGGGILRTQSGDVYAGSFAHHKFNGYGIYHSHFEYVIEGNFLSGILNGYAKVHWKDKAIYNGEFSNGIFSGQATYTTIDKSYQYVGKWLNGKPIDISETMKVDVEKIVGSPSSEQDKKDGKKDIKKDNKKKVATGNKKSNKEYLAPITLQPGQSFGKINITTLNANKPQQQQQQQQQQPLATSNTQTKHTGNTTKHIGTARSRKSWSMVGSLMTLPLVTLSSEYELNRQLLIRIRTAVVSETAAPGTEENNLVIGDPIPVWLKHPSLNEAVIAWDRFPATCQRYIDGVNALRGSEVIIEKPTSPKNPLYEDEPVTPVTPAPGSNSRLQDGTCVCCVLNPGDLRGDGQELCIIADFRLCANIVADIATDITRYYFILYTFAVACFCLKIYCRLCVHRPSRNEDRNQLIFSNTIIKSEYSPVSILSLGKRLDGTDTPSRLELVLLVPTVVLEETLEWEEKASLIHSTGSADDESTLSSSPLPGAAANTAVATGNNQSGNNLIISNTDMNDGREWQGCLWELRIVVTARTNQLNSENIGKILGGEVEDNNNNNNNNNSNSNEVEMESTVKSLCRWHAGDMKANAWHSVALSLRAPPADVIRIDGVDTSFLQEYIDTGGVDLVLDGCTLAKVVTTAKTVSPASKELGADNDDVGPDMSSSTRVPVEVDDSIALAWIPETSFYSSPTSTDESNGVSKDLTPAIQNPAYRQPSFVVRVGGAGFDGLVKIFAVCTE